MKLPTIQTFPERLKSQVPAKFLWQDQMGQKWPPDLMETRHLFYTLRMIWNHRMPEEAKLRPYKEYSTLSRSDAHLKDAVAALASELATRNDLTEEWRQDLDHMVKWLSTHQLE